MANPRTCTRYLADTDRDFFMTPEEAKEYGIIDEVIRKLSSPCEIPSSLHHTKALLFSTSADIILYDDENA